MNRLQPGHQLRSTLMLNAIRMRGQAYSEARSALKAVGLLSSEGITSQALRRAWLGDRPLRFDPVAPGARSEVESVDLAFRGSAYFFFHPLCNLLFGALRSNEKWLLLHAEAVPAWAIEDLEQRLTQLVASPPAQTHTMRDLRCELRQARKVNARLDHSSRAKRQPQVIRRLDVSVTHVAMLQLRSPIRDELMEPSALDGDDVPALWQPWVRRERTVLDELNALENADLIDRLAAALALSLEAALTGREGRFRCARDYVHEQLWSLPSSPLFDTVGEALSKAIRLTLSGCAVQEVGLVPAQLAALPRSWEERINPSVALDAADERD